MIESVQELLQEAVNVRQVGYDRYAATKDFDEYVLERKECKLLKAKIRLARYLEDYPWKEAPADEPIIVSA